MNHFKSIFFSVTLIYSCSLVPSAPAQHIAHADDELEYPKVHLMAKEHAQELVEDGKRDLKSWWKECKNKDLIKSIHQSHCAEVKFAVHCNNALRNLNNRKQQGASEQEINVLSNQWRRLNYLSDDQREKYAAAIKQASNNSDQCGEVLRLLAKHRGLYYDQALLLRSQQEEMIQDKRIMQAQIQRQAAQIRSLQLALRHQREPELQQIGEMSNILPEAPGGVRNN